MSQEEFYGRVRPEYVFLVLAALFGLGSLFLTPPIQVPDEDIHLFRAYYLSEGKLQLTNGEGKRGMILPESLVEMTSGFRRLFRHPERKTSKEEILAQFRQPLQPENTVFLQKDSFSPLPYLPQAAAIFWGRLFEASPITLLYLGRLSNFMVWAGLVFISLRRMPTFKWVFCLLALTPMSLFEAGSLSYDAFTNGVCFLWISLILHVSVRKGTLDRRWLFLILFISVLVTMAKNVYVFLFLLFLLIPGEKFEAPKRKWLWFSLIAGVNLLISALWIQKFIHFNFLLDSGLTPSHRQAQMTKVLKGPWVYVSTVWATLVRDPGSLIKQFVGVLGWLDTPLPNWLYPVSVGGILLTSVLEKNSEVKLSFKGKLILALSFCLCVLLVFLSMYVTLVLPPSQFIAGVQGRYFIPVVPLLFLLLYNRAWIRPMKGVSRLLPAFTVLLGILSSLTSLYTLCHRYYP